MRTSWYRQILSLLILLAIASLGHAQKLRINTYGSYVLDGTYHIYFKDGNFFDGNTRQGPQLGIGMEYQVSRNYGIELSALTRYTAVFSEPTMNSNGTCVDLKFNHYLLGLNAYPQVGRNRMQLFGGVSAGIVTQNAYNSVNPVGSEVNRSLTRFAWGARVGEILWLTTQVGLKLQAQWLSAIQFNEGAMNVHIEGLGSSPIDHSIANQFELGGGFIVKIGKHQAKNMR